jgi:glutaredoxin 3
MFPAKRIKLYSAPASPGCEAVRKVLRDHGVPFQEFNVTRDLNAMREWMEKSTEMLVPVIDIDGEILIGFEPTRLRAMLFSEESKS